MTVTVMTAGVPEKTDAKLPEKTVTDEIGQAPREQEKPIVYTKSENMYSEHFASARRRKRGSFGNIIFLQLVLSAVIALGVWAGKTFGGEEIRSVCESVIRLFA